MNRTQLQPKGGGEEGFNLHSHDQSLQSGRASASAGRVTRCPVDLWTGPLARACRLSALRRSPVDGRMDNPGACPRAHAQAVGCPQAPPGPTTR